jgi:hypothetical protein
MDSIPSSLLTASPPLNPNKELAVLSRAEIREASRNRCHVIDPEHGTGVIRAAEKGGAVEGPVRAFDQAWIWSGAVDTVKVGQGGSRRGHPQEWII